MRTRSSASWSASWRLPRRTRTPLPTTAPPSRRPQRKTLKNPRSQRRLRPPRPPPQRHPPPSPPACKNMGRPRLKRPHYTPQQEQPFMTRLVALRDRLLRILLCVLVVFLIL